MNTSSLPKLSRRHFISAGLGASTLILGQRRMFAGERGIVPTMIQAASQANIEVNRLRRNIVVLEGSGASIAVLTGNEVVCSGPRQLASETKGKETQPY